MAQTWTNLLYYIQSELSGNLNSIELTDADIRQRVVRSTLPDFSQYIPAEYLYLLTLNDRVTTAGQTTRDKFVIPVATLNIDIVRIRDVYWSNANTNAILSGQSSGLMLNPVDSVSSTRMLDMIQSLQPIQNVMFSPPDTLIFSQPVITNTILQLHVEHTSPITIPGDMYHKAFKKMALRDVLQTLIMSRSKFSTLNTPMGQIEMNVDMLIQLKESLTQEIKEVLDNLPPDPIVEFL